MWNQHVATRLLRGTGRGSGGTAPIVTEPHALLTLATTMPANSWREIPALMPGNGGGSYGWRGPQVGFMPTTAAINARDAAWGSTAIRSYGTSGPWGGLDQGCTMAYNPATYCIYMPAMGGHSAYAGNEVYRLDLKTLTARTDCEASPLTVRYVTDSTGPSDVYGDGPVAGPSAAHTWGGVCWDTQAQKAMFLAALGPFSLHGTGGSIPPGFQPPGNQTFYNITGRPVNVAFQSNGAGWTGHNWPCFYDPTTQAWERLVSGLSDARCLIGYNSFLAYDTARGRVGGFASTTGANGNGIKLGYWDRVAANWVTYGVTVRTEGVGTATQMTILYHPGEDRFYFTQYRVSTASMWLARASADGTAAEEYLVELPRRTGQILSYNPPTELQTCPADQTPRLDPAAFINWYSAMPGLERCPADNALYLTTADGYGQVWRLAAPYVGQTWAALSPAPPWPWSADGPQPWLNPLYAKRIYRRWQYICQSTDGKPLFILNASAIAGTHLYKGA